MSRSSNLQDVPLPLRGKLSALWASVMFCYIYADYFGLYVPGKLQSMLEGQMRPLGPATQGVLLGTSVMLAIPALMIAVSALFPTQPNRWLNIIFGAVYTGIILLTMWSWAFFVFYGIIEVALTVTIVWCAWSWPRVSSLLQS
ncbi:MAG: hypothetical protein JSU08_15625 [Acidobacteria bacterium]|nr:hypothetical protein [Acidobacteriota bacterium]